MARLSIDIPPEFHRIIKTEASLQSLSMRDFILTAVHEQIGKSHHASKSRKHDCPLCALYDGKHPHTDSRKALEAPLTQGSNRHYMFEDELP